MTEFGHGRQDTRPSRRAFLGAAGAAVGAALVAPADPAAAGGEAASPPGIASSRGPISQVLDANGYRARAEALRSAAGAAGLDALVVYSAPYNIGFVSATSGNTLYLANWQNGPQPTALVLPSKGEAVIFGTAMAYARGWAKQKQLWVEQQRDAVTPNGVADALRAAGVKGGRIGLVGRGEMTAPFLDGLRKELPGGAFEDADELLIGLKAARVNDPAEIALGKRAVENAEAMLVAMVDGARAGKWVYEVMADMKGAAFRNGSDFADVWLGSAPAGVDVAMTAWQGSHEIADGDLVQGVVFTAYQGRHAQLIRTGVKGKATAKHRQYVEAALKAQEVGRAALVPGRPVMEAVKAIQDTVTSLTPHPWGKDPVQTRCGHLQGMQYAEPGVSDPFVAYLLPDPSKTRNVIVQEGMRMVIHPNFSVPGLGWFCMGDNVVVRKTGAEWITTHPRECFEA